MKRDAYTWHPVEISEAHAIASIASGELTLTDPEGRAIHLRADRHIEHKDGNWTWIGHRVGDTPGNEAILTFGPTAVFGVIPTVGGDTLRLTTLRGRTWMVETDPARESAMAKGKWSDDALRVTPETRGPRMAGAGAEPATASAGPVTANASAANTVDMVIGYTPAFATRFGGAAGANTRLTFMVDVANQAYNASQVDGALRMVGSVQVNYTVNNSNSDALYAVTGKNCVDAANGGLSCTDAAVPAELQPLVSARETLGADLVALVRNFDQATQGGCGIAWLIGAEQSSITASDAEWAYAVVSDSNGEGAPSNGYICRDETLAHEAGHLMGLQHDRESASGSNATLEPEEYGRYPYSFGYRGGSAGVYTVMAYFSSGNSKVRVFSNPNVLCAPPSRQPAPCGIADQADNARALRQTMPVVATFRAAVPPRKVRNDFNFDGKSDVYWRSSTTGMNAIWFMNGGAPLSTPWVHQETNQAWQVAGIGDFNGDSKADVWWRNNTTGENYLHFMDGQQIVGGGASMLVNDANWRIVAFGDFDNDGKTDVYWRNDVNGLSALWLMNGTALKSMNYVHSETNPQWQVVGSGDFNGDHFADVLWRNTATGTLYIHMMQGTGILPSSGDAGGVGDGAWQIAAIADFDGDGMDDLMWRNSTTGVNALWRMQGRSATSYFVNTEPDANWKIVNSGDYNGDGRADLFWRHQPTGRNYIYFMDGATILPASGFIGSASSDWRPTGR